MKRTVDVEKFLADYDALVVERETKIQERDKAIETEKEKAEKVVSDNGYSDAIKEMLVAEVVSEKEKEFDLTELNDNIESFESYIILEEEVLEEETKEETPETQENVTTPENVNYF